MVRTVALIIVKLIFALLTFIRTVALISITLIFVLLAVIRNTRGIKIRQDNINIALLTADK